MGTFALSERLFTSAPVIGARVSFWCSFLSDSDNLRRLRGDLKEGDEILSVSVFVMAVDVGCWWSVNANYRVASVARFNLTVAESESECPPK